MTEEKNNEPIATDNNIDQETVNIDEIISSVVEKTQSENIKLYKMLIKEVKDGARELGFNADWNVKRRKYDFFERMGFLGAFLFVALILGAGLIWLVNENKIDSTTFSTLIAVLLGAALDRSLSERQKKDRI